MKDYIQVFTTTVNKDDAREIARDLVENRLVACAQVIGPIQRFESDVWSVELLTER